MIPLLREHLEAGRPRRPTENDVANRRIVRGDFDAEFFSPLPRVQLDIYREALLIFYGTVSVHLRAMRRPLPGDRSDRIG